MVHDIWLLKHWPKENQPNQDPVIYKLAEEFNEKQAEQDLKAAEKEGYIASLLEITGYDTPEECNEAIENSDEIDNLPPKHKNLYKTAKLTYQGKDYYFPKMIISRVPGSDQFNTLFDLNK